MSPTTPTPAAREEALHVAESAREATRTRPSFAAELFLGRVPQELVVPWPEPDAAALADAEPHIAAIERALRDHLDPEQVVREGRIPDEAMQALHEAGAFRLKIPKAYGGLGFTQSAYNRTVARVATWCSSTAILLSGHQSIGVPTPLKLFGTDEQKQRFLPRMASGAISAFALTEPEAGSDPARMTTTARPSEDGEAWILDGEKLWCTNGPIADTIIVMACTPPKLIGTKARTQISAFIVEMDTPGCEVVHRCDFMGYAGIQSGLLRFRGVRVPRENLLGAEGQGLKLALITLNTGRLTLPATNAAAAWQCVGIARRWAAHREQWGSRIGDHEAVAVQLGWMAAHAYAMQSLSDYAAALADRGDTDIRLEAAMAKLFGSEMVFQVADRAVQLRGGRGYETKASLEARGEVGEPMERLFREARLNRIVEGTSEIMRLFLAREALDPHLRRAGALARPGASRGARTWSFLKAAAYYPFWYLKRLVPRWGTPAGLPSALRPAWRRLERESRRLARRIFHAMVRHGPALEHRQALLGRLVDDGTDLVAVGVTLGHAARSGATEDVELAGLFARHAFQRLRERRTAPARLDAADVRVAHALMDDRYIAFERDVLVPPAAPGGTSGDA